MVPKVSWTVPVLHFLLSLITYRTTGHTFTMKGRNPNSRCWMLLVGAWISIFAVTTCHCFLLLRHLHVGPPLTVAVGERMVTVSVSMAKKPSSSLGETVFPIHHTAIKTRNMTVALNFYSLLGFEASVKFRAGPAKAAWLHQPNAPPGGSRLELIEVPSFLLGEPQGTTFKAPDLIQQQAILGQNHLALDVTESIKSLKLESITEWLACLNQTSIDTFGKTLRIAVEPYQTMIGKGVYELAFLYDADGALIELLHLQTELEQTVSSGWDPTETIEFLR
jgi:catechol 2,3-dioxygenase-like lactoylglutathione lyase family enzyme